MRRGLALAAAIALLLLAFASPGRAFGQTEANPPERLWQVPLSPAPAMPAAGEGAVYVATHSEDGASTWAIEAYTADDGAERWRHEVGAELPGIRDLAFDGGTVLYVAYDIAAGIFVRSDLVALDAATGSERWRVTLDLQEPLAPVAAEGRVFVAGEAGGLLAFDLATGRALWRLEADGVAPPAVADGVAYAVHDATSPSTGQQVVAAYDARSGERRWTAPVGVLPTTSPLAISDEILFVVGFDGVQGFRIADGNRVTWTREPAYYHPYATDADAAGPVVKAEVPSEDRNDWERSAVVALDGATGFEAWCSLVEEAEIATPPLIAAGTVLVRGEREITALDRLTGVRRWRLPAERAPRIAVDGDVLYVADLGGSLSAYRLPPAAETGAVTTARPTPETLEPLGSCPRTRTTGESVAFTVVAAAATLGLGSLLTGFVARDILRGLASRAWPRTTGRIVGSLVTGGWRAGYYPRVFYHYSVGGTSYVGSRVRFMPAVFSRVEADEIVAPYPADTEVEVHYHPRKPKHATLEPRIGLFTTGVGLTMGLVLLGMGVYFLLQRPWTFG